MPAKRLFFALSISLTATTLSALLSGCPAAMPESPATPGVTLPAEQSPTNTRNPAIQAPTNTNTVNTPVASAPAPVSAAPDAPTPTDGANDAVSSPVTPPSANPSPTVDAVAAFNIRLAQAPYPLFGQGKPTLIITSRNGRSQNVAAEQLQWESLSPDLLVALSDGTLQARRDTGRAQFAVQVKADPLSRQVFDVDIQRMATIFAESSGGGGGGSQTVTPQTSKPLPLTGKVN